MKIVGLEITFTSGATIFVEVESWEHKRSHGSRSLTWVTRDSAKRRLVSVDMDEIAAIVEVRK